MTSDTAERTIVAISLDRSLYERPDILARLGAMSPGESMEVAAFFEPNALQILVDALLPGQFLWATEYGPDRKRTVRVTRL